jgi:hypothetical protein
MKYMVGLVCTFLFAIWLALPSPASAHLFGGPPFLSLNGKDAITNPTYMSLPAFTIPQDNAQGSYLVHQPIKFVIDLQKLPVPATIAEQSTFKWHWEEGGSEVTYGATQTHVYDKIGTHLVTLDVLAPGETDYLNLDTVRVQVVPKAGYKLPSVSIKAVKDSFEVNKPITFVSATSVDSSTSVKGVIWDFGDSTQSKEAQPKHTYSQRNFLNFVYVQVTDQNGFTSEAGVTASANKGVISLTPLTTTKGSIPLVSASSRFPLFDALKPYLPLILGIVIVGMVVLMLTIGLIRQKRQLRYPHA